MKRRGKRIQHLTPLGAVLVSSLLVIGAVGAAMAIGLGGRSSAIKDARTGTMPAHPISAPSTKSASLAAAHRRKLRYLETDTFKLASGDTDGSSFKCPRTYKAINGYFGSNKNEVVPIHDSVGNSLRVWQIFVHNFGHDAQVYVGAVCLKP